eukprot:6615533-Pyramimonas_sp.AAC.1
MAKLLGDAPEKAGQALRPQEPRFPTLIRYLRILHGYSDNGSIQVKGHQGFPQPFQGMGRQSRGAGSTASQYSGRALGPARTHRPEFRAPQPLGHHGSREEAWGGDLVPTNQRL